MLDSEIIDRIDKRFDELNNKLDRILRDNTKTVELQDFLFWVYISDYHKFIYMVIINTGVKNNNDIRKGPAANCTHCK